MVGWEEGLAEGQGEGWREGLAAGRVEGLAAGWVAVGWVVVGCTAHVRGWMHQRWGAVEQPQRCTSITTEGALSCQSPPWLPLRDGHCCGELGSRSADLDIKPHDKFTSFKGDPAGNSHCRQLERSPSAAHLGGGSIRTCNQLRRSES